MRSTIVVPAAALSLLVASALAAGAQSSATMSSSLPVPANHQLFPSGPGKERGLHELNNSGQVGTATIHASGESSEIVIQLKSVPAGKVEQAALIRDPSGDCTSISHGNAAATLTPVSGGMSRSTVSIPIDRLLSGNYYVLVSSKEKPDHYFSCGQLYK